MLAADTEAAPTRAILSPESSRFAGIDDAGELRVRMHKKHSLKRKIETLVKRNILT